MKQAAQPQETVAGFEPFPSQAVVIANALIDALPDLEGV